MRILNLFFIFATLLTSTSCARTGTPKATSSLTVINAINGNNYLITNFSPQSPHPSSTDSFQQYSTALTIPDGGVTEFSSYVGLTDLRLVPGSDTQQIFFSGRIDLPIGKIQTLYLFGDTAHIDTMLNSENIPYYTQKDSVSGVRFVNLLANSQGITINLQGNPNSILEFPTLKERMVTNFRTYPITSNIPGYYNFEIHDLLTDSLIAPFAWYYTPGKNNTIVIMGSETDPNYPAYEIQVNNY